MSGAAVLLAELIAAAALYGAGRAARARLAGVARRVLRGGARRPRRRAPRPRRRPRSLTATWPSTWCSSSSRAPLLVLGSPVALAPARDAGPARAARGRGWRAPASGGSRSRRRWRSPTCPGSTRPPLATRSHVAEHVAYLGAAVLFWRAGARADPVPRRPGPLGRLLYLLLAPAPLAPPARG